MAKTMTRENCGCNPPLKAYALGQIKHLNGIILNTASRAKSSSNERFEGRTDKATELGKGLLTTTNSFANSIS
jgi:hypothetical protein